MSNAADSTGVPQPIIDVAVQLDDDTKTRLNRAATVSEFESAEAFVEEATKRLIDETLDEDGELDCPHDDCDRTFPTRAERRGHLGSSEHALDVPEGNFWCGYCGYGPTNWRGINAHHGSSDHEGEPIRLSEVPDREDLVAPDKRPDHKDPELLAELYDEHDGNYTAMCRAHDFEVSPGRVRHYLVEFGIHDVTPQASSDGDGPKYRDREWLQEHYEAAGGNISEMHRRIEREDEVDVAYTTLVNTLKKVGIHDPEQRESNETDGETDDAGEESVDPDDPGVDAEDTNPHDVGTEQRDDDDSTESEPDDESPEGARSSESDPDQSMGAVDDDRIHDVIVVDDPEDATEFSDLATPDWLLAKSFHIALELSDSSDDFAENLGWGDPEELRLMVETIGLEDELGGEPDA
ncbi:hypothetical protein [Halonotius aquaticus]|uniref:hypothetical protein n=1 Tax=Halonotius aquaticus TaxID=2216978 RepID=UPI001059058D|nr:hypothetical protein [Halonotius aquaticus]